MFRPSPTLPPVSTLFITADLGALIRRNPNFFTEQVAQLPRQLDSTNTAQIQTLIGIFNCGLIKITAESVHPPELSQSNAVLFDQLVDLTHRLLMSDNLTLLSLGNECFGELLTLISQLLDTDESSLHQTTLEMLEKLDQILNFNISNCLNRTDEIEKILQLRIMFVFNYIKFFDDYLEDAQSPTQEQIEIAINKVKEELKFLYQYFEPYFTPAEKFILAILDIEIQRKTDGRSVTEAYANIHMDPAIAEAETLSACFTQLKQAAIEPELAFDNFFNALKALAGMHNSETWQKLIQVLDWTFGLRTRPALQACSADDRASPTMKI